MFLTDRDSGRPEIAATPATRADAEAALRDMITGSAGSAADEIGTQENCEGLCPECAIELALQEASEKGLTPESPEFGVIFERIFNEANIGNGSSVRFLGAHKLSDGMPDELKAKLAEAGHPAFSDETSDFDPLAGFGILKDRSIYDEPVPSLFGDTAMTPFRFAPEPHNTVLGGPRGVDFDLDQDFLKILRETFGGAQQEPDDFDDDNFEEERRGVVQDLAAAALNVSEQLHQPGAEAVAEALSEIAALARETYGV